MNKNGFTLIEVLAAFSLLLILISGFSAAALQIKHYQNKNTARLAEILRYESKMELQ